MLKRLIPLALVALAIVTGCRNPNAGDIAGRVIGGAVTAAPAFFINDAQEIQLGRQTMAEVFTQMPEFPDPEIRDYVTEVGMKLVAQQDRQGLPWEFHVLHSKEINAFAAPGGFLFVTTGALRVMTNEAQLAGVMGHEVAHVTKKHSVEGIKKAMIAQGILTGALQGNDSKLIDAGAKIGANLILKGFDRGAEEEADHLGAKWAYGAGYDPRELASFLDILRKTSGEIPSWLVYFSDHPRTDDRLTKIQGYIDTEKLELSGTQKGEAIYQMKVLDKLKHVADPVPAPAPGGTDGAESFAGTDEPEAPSPEPSPTQKPNGPDLIVI